MSSWNNHLAADPMVWLSEDENPSVQYGMHGRMNSTAERLISRQDPDRRWKLERTFNGRFHVNIEQKGKPTKRLTLCALRLLKTYYG